MSKIAFLFPGQGSQTIGMGSALHDSHPVVRPLFQEASDILGWDLLSVCREGPEDRLRQTDIAQPALYVTGYATAIALQALGLKAQGTAGHSIGEYAALAYAEVFSFAEGLRLVKERARLMHLAAQTRPGAMAAVLGMSADLLETICKEAATTTSGVCVPVNYNSPEQIVIAGTASAIQEATKLASEKGAKRVIALNVSGAFHSPLMSEAAMQMRSVLSTLPFKTPTCAVALNADGKLHLQVEDIQRLLGDQLDHPVQWVNSSQSLISAGYDFFVECGPGRVLAGLLKRIDRKAQIFSTDTPEAISQAASVALVAHQGTGGA